jgi:hypothetical protein
MKGSRHGPEDAIALRLTLNMKRTDQRRFSMASVHAGADEGVREGGADENNFIGGAAGALRTSLEHKVL